MELRVNLHGVSLHQSLCHLEVAFALDALNFSKEFSEERAQLLVVVHLHISLSVSFHEFHHLLGLTLLVAPVSNQCTIAHVCLLDVVAQTDSHQLRHQSVHHVGIVLSLVSLTIRSQTQFLHLRVSQVIESEEVGTCLFNR